MLGHLTRIFLRGLLVVVPLALTIYVFVNLLRWVDSLRQLQPVSRFDFPGLGVLLTLALILLVGALARHILAQEALRMVERWVGRLPLVKLVYGSLRDLTDALVGDKKSFDQPVWFEESETSDVKRLGFVTRQSMEVVGLDDHVAVYQPMSFTFGGFLILVPKKRVHKVELDSGTMMALIVSGGVSGKQAPEVAALPPKE